MNTNKKIYKDNPNFSKILFACKVKHILESDSSSNLLHSNIDWEELFDNVVYKCESIFASFDPLLSIYIFVLLVVKGEVDWEKNKKRFPNIKLYPLEGDIMSCIDSITKPGCSEMIPMENLFKEEIISPDDVLLSDSDLVDICRMVSEGMTPEEAANERPDLAHLVKMISELQD